MSIVERTEKAIEDGQQRLQGDKEFVALQEFYAEMQRAGLALKRGYDIPPIDTIGRDLLTTRERAELGRS